MRIFLIVVFSFFSFSFYGQNDTISIVRHTDNDIVIPKDLKVVFRGIQNSLSIEVPNCKSFTATGNGLSLISKNNYTLTPGAGSETTITIDIILKNNKKIIEKHVFEIRRTSGFITTINGKAGIVRMQKNHLKDAKIKISFEDKNLVFSNEIVAFALKIPGQPSIQVIGNKIDDRTYERILRSSTIGDQITISDIKLRVMDDRLKGASCFLTSPIVVEVY